MHNLTARFDPPRWSSGLVLDCSPADRGIESRPRRPLFDGGGMLKAHLLWFRRTLKKKPGGRGFRSTTLQRPPQWYRGRFIHYEDRSSDKRKNNKNLLGEMRVHRTHALAKTQHQNRSDDQHHQKAHKIQISCHYAYSRCAGALFASALSVGSRFAVSLALQWFLFCLILSRSYAFH